MKLLPSLLLACTVLVSMTANAGTLTTLYTVPAVSEASNPQAVTAFGGKLYGVTYGTVFQIAPGTGAFNTLHSFTGATLAFAAPVALDGKLYGTNLYGGASDSGVVYQIDPATGAYAEICSGGPKFASLRAGLTVFHGALYGVGTLDGSDTNGQIYRVDTSAKTCTVVYSFAGGKAGSEPFASMIADGDFLFGTTVYGGSHDLGTLFRFNPNAQTLKVEYSFKGSDISHPATALTVANGVIYGAAISGGEHKNGGIFAFDTESRNETTLYSFPPGKVAPLSGLTSENGLIYGVAGVNGVKASPFLYSIDSANGTLNTVFTFTGEYDVPRGGEAAIALGANGLLYATLPGGGAYSLGGVYSFDPASGDETTVHSFAGNTTAQPSALIKVGSALYGTAAGSGTAGQGSIFKVLPGKAQGETLYSFTGPDGAAPKSALLDVGGILYGITTAGGPKGGGTLFSFDPATRALTTLGGFNKTNGLYASYPTLVQIGNFLYGIEPGDDAVLKFDLASLKLSALATVPGNVNGLVAGNGLLYGTTQIGGASNDGTLFQLDPASATLTTLFNFQTSGTGKYPSSGLLYNAGALFGFTSGATEYKAAAFRFDIATSTFTLLHSFAGKAQFDAPPIVLGTKLYAPLASSGSDANGALLRLNQQPGATGTLYSFTGGADGSYPATSLLHINGHFYGTTSGGPNGSRDGTVFSYRP